MNEGKSVRSTTITLGSPEQSSPLNISHTDEMEGKDIPQELTDGMQDFLDSNRSKGK